MRRLLSVEARFRSLTGIVQLLERARFGTLAGQHILDRLLGCKIGQIIHTIRCIFQSRLSH
jgi:hypothetical protein